MTIQQVEIQRFRNLSELALEPGPGFNALYGRNGSGKTSFLEALFFLSLGRSFRTRSANNLIQETAEGFSIFCRVQRERDARLLGTQRMRGGERRIRVDGKEESSYVETAKALPLLLINTDEHQLITGGPEFRRQFMSWGTFHVEPRFLPAWRRLQQILRQRNAALKRGGGSFEEIASWDRELIMASELMDELRRQYLEQLTPCVKSLIHLLLDDIGEVDFLYMPGWNEREGLERILMRSLMRDQQLGYTQYGAHRMDWIIKVGGRQAREVLSRGQQKLMVYALRLAQGLLLKNLHHQNCVYLIDDFIAELDKQKRELVVKSLKSLEAQVFVTGVEGEELFEVLPTEAIEMFHVEHGEIACVTKYKTLPARNKA